MLRYGEAFSVTQRLILPGQDTFVKLEDGTGWLFESAFPWASHVPIRH